MEFIDYYNDVSGRDTYDGDDDNKRVSEESTYDREFINDTEIENNLLDYYCWIIMSDAEEDPFSQSDMDAFLDEDVEARNYCLYLEGGETFC